MEFKSLEHHRTDHNYRTINERIIKTEQMENGDIIIYETWPSLPDNDKIIVKKADGSSETHYTVMKKKTKYILQTEKNGYGGCWLIALLNARIYYGYPCITSLDDPRWEKWVDKYKCRHGGCLQRTPAIKELSLEAKKIDRDEISYNLPSVITCFTKAGFHNSLVVEAKGDWWTIVNYDSFYGKLVSIVNKNSIKFLERGHSNDEHYRLRLLQPSMETN